MKSDSTSLGVCCICGRNMPNQQGINTEHHFIPKSRGGKEKKLIHEICHRKIHSLWSEVELAREFSDPVVIKEHPEMDKFIRWLAKKPDNYMDNSERHNRKGKR